MLSLALLFLAAFLDIGTACDDLCRPGWKYFQGKCYDKCRPGWKYFEGKCYGFGETEVTWANAQTICRALGAKLVQVNTSEENDYVSMLAAVKQASVVWISATDIFHDGMWEWTSAPNTFLSSYTNWGPDEPNNKGESDSLIASEVFSAACKNFQKTFNNEGKLFLHNNSVVEDCGDLHKNTGYQWNDRSCNLNANFICVGIPTTAEPEVF